MTAKRLAGKRAIITGASRGMGLRFAQALAEEGGSVAILARQSDELAAAPDIVGSGSFSVACDLTSPGMVRETMGEATARLGGLDILVNNAAVCLLHQVEDATDQDILRELHTNFAGPIFTAREAIPHMKRAGGGDIVNISSESVRMPVPFLSIYAATKSGLEGLSAGLRAELRDDDIRVSILRSGGVAGSTLDRYWNPAKIPEFWSAIEQSGHAKFSGTMMAPETMTQALISILTLPRDATVDLIEVRATNGTAQATSSLTQNKE